MNIVLRINIFISVCIFLFSCALCVTLCLYYFFFLIIYYCQRSKLGMDLNIARWLFGGWLALYLAGYFWNSTGFFLKISDRQWFFTENSPKTTVCAIKLQNSKACSWKLNWDNIFYYKFPNSEVFFLEKKKVVNCLFPDSPES